MLFFSGIKYSHAQLSFNNGLTALQLAQLLAGQGVSISNAVINCPTNAIGSFNGTSSIGMANGIILTNGSTSIVSPNANLANATVCNNSPGDAQLDALIGNSSSNSFDACALEFDIVPLCDTLKFNYVFGSEEYPEFVNQGVSDAFAFFVSGPGITGQPNIAVLPGTSTPVTIDNVNAGTNSQFYIANSGTSIEYDGYTTKLTAWVVVQPCQTYHLKIVIEDVGDCLFDSGVFIEAGSLQCQAPISATATVQNAIEGCQNGAFQFCRTGSTSSPVTIPFTIAGTAINGTDYNSIGSSITIPAGQSCTTLTIVPIADGITEPTESIFLVYQPGICPSMDTAKIFISDSPTLNAGPDKTICTGGSASIGMPPVTGTTYSWTPSAGLSNAAISNPTVTLTNGGSAPVTTNYILTAAVGSCSIKDTVKVKVDPLPTSNAGIDLTICGGTALLAGSVGGGAVVGIWSGGTGTFNPNDSTLNSIYTPSAAEIDAGSITLTLTANDHGACAPAIDQMVILINPQAIVSAGPDQTICIGNTVTLAGSVGGSATSGVWTGGAGTYNPDNTHTTPVYTPSAAEETAGTVTLTFTSSNPNTSCTPADDQVVITINPFPTANAGSGQFVCAGSNISLAGSIGGSAASGTWTGGTGTYSPDNTALNAVYTPSAAEYTAGLVTLTLITNDPPGPCTFSSSNVIYHFYESPAVSFSADVSQGCPILCTNFTDGSSIGGGSTIVSWNWNFGDGSAPVTTENSSHCFPVSGLYDIKLTAVSNNGCSSSLTKVHLVQVFNIPTAAFTNTPDPATVLDPVITFNNLSSSDVSYWHWDFGDNTSLSPAVSNPVHDYPAETAASYMVTLIVHNAEGCYDTTSKNIIIKPEFSFFLPNSFSPNGDGINDDFFASGVGITGFEMWIFDRWGNLIFHGNELNDKWNGKANGGKDAAQIDVYVWKVELTDVFNKLHDYIGTVSIVK